MGAGLFSQATAHLLRLGASRRHEYAADEVASQLYGADAIISALDKIHVSAARGAKRDVLGARGGAFSHLCIASYSGGARESHPCTGRRQRLKLRQTAQG